ncbi:SMODS domain-containing nucleotidyltransferase [Streptomyces chartreusis]|uniref:Nucleotidyltransferase n=1 Tax=Streptomyces chartreusis TaxID=1969 RepID=A0A7H8TH88_STRCX|nr:hypothetical protein [Streptomyces chartreusis]QKZ22871.1 hypothetical protein HUT05_39300 [Streptomyces chartreusis]
MATNPGQAFNVFHERITLTEAQKATLNARKNIVEDKVRSAFPAGSDMPFMEAKLIGSTGRNTAIRPLNDIDLMVRFSAENGAWNKYRQDSQAFLYRVREALNSASTVGKIGARGQAVRLFYTDGIHVDVAPVFKYSDGGYGIPNGSGGWMTTDPDVHAAYMTRRNSELGSNLKRLQRGMKAWNRTHSQHFGSFHLDVMVAEVFSSLNNNSRDASHKFFLWGQNHMRVADPAGYGGDLSAGMSGAQRSLALSALRAAEDRAKQALAAEERGDYREAIRLWRIVFGDEFPAYG